MSRHHVAQKWSTFSPKLKAVIKAQLPLPCVECGQLVTPADSWQVGHRTDAMDGGKPTAANTGPVHVKSPHWPRSCNQIAGGKRGAAVTNSRKRTTANREQDIRPW